MRSMADNHPPRTGTRRGFLADLGRGLIALAATAGVGWLAARHGVSCEAGSFCPGCPELATCSRPEAQAVRNVQPRRR